VPDEIVKKAACSDAGARVTIGREIGINERGHRAYMNETTYKLILNSYLEKPTQPSSVSEQTNE
jgi:hypothetical protein